MGRDLLSREELALLLSEDSDQTDASTDPAEENPAPFSPGDFGRLASAVDRILMEGGHAWSLSLGAAVEFLPCQVALVSPATLAGLGPTAVGELTFTGQLRARGYLLMPMSLALEVSRRALGLVGIKSALDEAGRSALGEAVNFLVAELRAQVHRTSQRKVATSPPKIYFCEAQQGPEQDQLVEARSTVTFDGQPAGDILVWAELSLARLLAASAARPVRALAFAPDASSTSDRDTLRPAVVASQDDTTEPEEMPSTPRVTQTAGKAAPKDARVSGAESHHLLSVEVGRGVLTKEQRDKLALGAVLPLDRLAGESVDVLVDGEVVARGEVVVVDETIGVKITKMETSHLQQSPSGATRGSRGDAEGSR